MPARIKHALARTYEDVIRNHTLQMAAALSYYFVLSLFPPLILLSAIVAYLPVPNLFDQALSMMTRVLPADSMGLVRRVLSDVITPNRGTFLSLGILGTLWTASGGFAAAIQALNIAYDVEDDRPFWKTRPLAVGLALVTGALMLVALSVMIVGPRFGEWLAGRVQLSHLFVLLWTYIHWSISIGFTILAVEAWYFLAPNIKPRFLAKLPGAILAVGCWLALSYLLGLYFRHFANFNKTYGTLGAGIALMTWLYCNELKHMPQAPSSYLQRFTYDTITHSKPVMEFVIKQVGAERVMVGSDYCFTMGYDRPVQFLDEVDLTTAQRQMILGGNAERILKL